MHLLIFSTLVDIFGKFILKKNLLNSLQSLLIFSTLSHLLIMCLNVVGREVDGFSQFTCQFCPFFLPFKDFVALFDSKEVEQNASS